MEYSFSIIFPNIYDKWLMPKTLDNLETYKNNYCFVS